MEGKDEKHWNLPDSADPAVNNNTYPDS